MKQPILSIVIPTFNRAAPLALLIDDLNVVLEQYHADLQIVICDNCSTDGSLQVMNAFAKRWPGSVKLVRRAVNIGMEGNIASSMMEADGRHVWMLSDHQRLCIPEILRTLARLPSLNFDVGHAKILQWAAVLESPHKVSTWSDLSPRKRGEMLFALSNLSTLIFRRELAHEAARMVFRACVWGFPHLGLLTRFNDRTRFVEFESLSAFPTSNHAAQLVHSYDKILVRYRSSIDCLVQLRRESGACFDISGFFTPAYRTSFRGDMLQFLMQPEMNRCLAVRKLIPVTLANPWSLKAVSGFALVAILFLPSALRLSFANTTRGVLMRLLRRHKPGNA